MDDLEKASVDRNHGTGYDADYYKSDTELKAGIDRLRSQLVAAEGEADRLRSAYDDVRALNIKFTMTCTAELATKDAHIAELEAWRAACQEVRCYRVVEAETEALRAELANKDARNEEQRGLIRDLTTVLEKRNIDNEALRKQLAEFGAGEDTTTMTRKSFAEVLQALADVKKELTTLREQHSNVFTARGGG